MTQRQKLDAEDNGDIFRYFFQFFNLSNFFAQLHFCRSFLRLCRPFLSTFFCFSRSILPLIWFSWWWCSCRQISTNCEIKFQFNRSTQKHVVVHSWLSDFSSSQSNVMRNFIFFLFRYFLSCLDNKQSLRTLLHTSISIFFSREFLLDQSEQNTPNTCSTCFCLLHNNNNNNNFDDENDFQNFSLVYDVCEQEGL